MYIAMNRFRVQAGSEEAFEKVWRERESFLEQVPGFVEFHLLRGHHSSQQTVYVSHSTWESRAAFTAWTESEAFHKAHQGARTPDGALVGAPEFEGFEVVV